MIKECERETVWAEGRWINLLHTGQLAHEWHEELP